MTPLSEAESFCDVWFMEKNAKKRPSFLRQVATPEAVDKLLSCLSNETEAPTRRVSLGLLNRLASDPVVCKSLAQEARLKTLLERTTENGEEGLQTRLMWYETCNAIIVGSDVEVAHRLASEVGFLQLSLDAIQVPSSEDQEALVYEELMTLLACKALHFLTRSEAFVTDRGDEYLVKQLTVLGTHSKWERPETLATLARMLLQNRAAMVDVWVTLTPLVEGATATIRAYAEKKWTACQDYVNFIDKKCNNCSKGGVKLLNCGRCHAARYCSQRCQKDSWYMHKKVCVPIRPGAAAKHKAVASQEGK